MTAGELFGLAACAVCAAALGAVVKRSSREHALLLAAVTAGAPAPGGVGGGRPSAPGAGGPERRLPRGVLPGDAQGGGHHYRRAAGRPAVQGRGGSRPWPTPWSWRPKRRCWPRPSPCCASSSTPSGRSCACERRRPHEATPPAGPGSLPGNGLLLFLPAPTARAQGAEVTDLTRKSGVIETHDTLIAKIPRW